MSFRLQRIRDPLHNLIEFPADEFHDAMWRVIQSHQYQRLRRVKQLGFSELVYPGATHTRFAHSIGVFHTARILMKIIEKHLGSEFKHSKAQIALAAALVHDLGHGPYSHAFEEVGKKLKLPMADHEKVTDSLVREGEVATALNGLGGGFASDVADLIKKAGPASIYRAVVSSQFDADRLDYMRRDRLMTGTQHGAIDCEWLISNLEVGSVPHGVDSERVGDLETFVLGPKALYAAETYLLGLFQLYATVYLHKATRGVEKLFTELMVRVFKLARDGSTEKTGLSDHHPLIRFAISPDNLERVLALDDSVIGGALFMMTEAEDRLVSEFSSRLRDRKLYKCVDIREVISERVRSSILKKQGPKKTSSSKTAAPAKAQDRLDLDAVQKELVEKVEKASNEIETKLRTWAAEHEVDVPTILLDKTERSMYKSFEESKGPLEQIMIKTGPDNTKPVDVATVSQVVKAISPLKVLRVYFREGDEKAKKLIDQTLQKEARNVGCN